VQHIIIECTIFDQERDKVNAVVMRTENWSLRFNNLSTMYYKSFREYIDSIIWENDKGTIYANWDNKCINYRE